MLTQAGIGKSPTQGAVVGSDIAPLKRGRAFAHDPWTAGHTFDTARNQ